MGKRYVQDFYVDPHSALLFHKMDLGLKHRAVRVLGSRVFRVTGIVIFLIAFFVTLMHLPMNTLGNEYHFSSPAPSRPVNEQINPASPSYYLITDWSRFAYVQYVTNTAYLCNSVMIFETLHRMNSKADRLLMYPAGFPIEGDSAESILLRKAHHEYGVKLVPIEVQSKFELGRDYTWAESYTKLLAFNQTQYDRVLSLDSDATILQPMDELFLLPPCPIAMPRAYWMNPDDRVLSSQMMLIQPSTFEFNRIKEAIENASLNEYDMEIVNNLYKDSALVLPHRSYDLLTGEFRAKNHSSYLGNPVETWDPDVVMREAKFLHFSDWPVPKPWIQAQEDTVTNNQPECNLDSETDDKNCRTRDLWLGFYTDFAQRRKDVCRMSLKKSHKRSSDERPERSPGIYEPTF
ncbi:nucleotide-diphospho-sugar transferase [Aspergillus heteromorphus CBS 117.55]|uniref:Nucleotide-diphospho-sugar transferase n=1 Tax=Aspergillus heteromorphus CBS 117.55 TaxID=1448321 RepID=A0A317VV15_9EURO|nr:nucleotide-diphospho-sugar transferase [Aspergillus heteromorphus CBS 117.55]PWY78244.1 nucleotide-diphospho-sugar transferase [Aspergillus heteromorphus CBS 117.55]